MSTRAYLAIGFAGLAALALFAASADAKPETTISILPGVWFREGDLKNLGHSNNVIIEMRDYLIVVDANFPSGARAALLDAKRISKKPVKYVFDTHHHGDHAYGNPIWTAAGAITLAHQGVADEMRRYEPRRWKEAAAERKDVGDLKLATAEPPRQTFKEDLYVLEDPTRRVEFRFFGWAHTRGDGFVYLPREQVLCTGDAVVNGPYNFTGDANLGNWPNVLRAAAKLQVKHVLPGHGRPGGPELITGQEQFFVELLRGVKAAVAQGKEPTPANVKLPGHVTKWIGDFYADQLRHAHQEITTGKPHGDLPH
jgi:glyoxylase-like metal-dependent hydrolase (beta-lactamase superfamily II)